MRKKRLSLWVDPPLQAHAMGFILTLLAASLVVISLSVHRGLADEAVRSRQVFHTLDWLLGAMRAPLLVSSAVCLLASAFLALAWSHRLAGPLRVLSSAFERIGQGDLSGSLRVRRNDLLGALSDDAARMQEGLRNLVEADRRALAAASRRIEAIAASLPPGHPAHKELDKLLEEVRRACSAYKL